MTKPAFIVEGQQEQKIIERLCGGVPVRLLGTNGESCSMQAIAKKIAALSGGFGNRHYPIIVVFDRETRKKSCDELKIELHKHLKAIGQLQDQFIIHIIDRTIESWIAPFINEEGNWNDDGQISDDGKRAQSGLERRLDKAGKRYHKTTLGVSLFCSINPIKLSRISDNFRIFRDSTSNFCTWMRGGQDMTIDGEHENL